MFIDNCMSPIMKTTFTRLPTQWFGEIDSVTSYHRFYDYYLISQRYFQGNRHPKIGKKTDGIKVHPIIHANKDVSMMYSSLWWQSMSLQVIITTTRYRYHLWKVLKSKGALVGHKKQVQLLPFKEVGFTLLWFSGQ